MKKLLNFMTTLAIVSLILAPLRLPAAADTPSYPELVSGATDTFSGNGKAIGMSKDGRYILLSTTNDFYLRDQQLATTSPISINTLSSYPTSRYQSVQLAGDGTMMSFVTQRKYVNPTSSLPTTSDLFLENLTTGNIVDITSTAMGHLEGYNGTFYSGGGSGYFSDDSNSVAYGVNYSYTCGNSVCTNRSVYNFNVSTNTLTPVAVSLNQYVGGVPTTPPMTYTVKAISGDGNYVFYNDTSGNLWEYNVETNQATQVFSASYDYSGSGITISTDGRYIGFYSDANNMQIPVPAGCDQMISTSGACTLYYRYDTSDGVTQLVTGRADGSLPDKFIGGGNLVMSGDGNTFLWSTTSIMASNATYYRSGQYYSKDMSTDAIHPIVVNAQGIPADAGSFTPFITGDGTEAVISLAAPNFGGPLDCTANSDVNPNRPVPCVNAYLVSTSPIDISDSTPPTITSVNWSQNPVPMNATAPELSLSVSDTGSDFSLGEYYIGDTDPGLGNGTQLQYDTPNNVLYAYLYDITQTPGTYNIHYRVYDNVGNWSQTYTTQLVVTGAQPPTGLAATSPTKTSPVLSWNAATSATSYNVYRDNSLIGSTSNTTYTDTTASEGVHSYTVSTVSSGSESSQSNAITVILDKTRPVMSFTAPSSFATTFTAGPTVTVVASDTGSGLSILAIHVYTSANQLLTTCGTATPTQLASGTMSCSLASLPNGTYYIKAGSFDNANNNQTINSGNFTIQH